MPFAPQEAVEEKDQGDHRDGADPTDRRAIADVELTELEALLPCISGPRDE